MNRKLVSGIVLSILLVVSVTFPLASASGTDDDGTRDIGGDAVEEYDDSDDLYYAIETLDALLNEMKDDGVNQDFRWTNDVAWDQDFEEYSGSWADDADMSIFVGHGSSNYIWFNNRNYDDGNANAWTMRDEGTLGQKDLEWLLLWSCHVLDVNNGPMHDELLVDGVGLHFILGWDTVAWVGPSSVDTMSNFGYRMTSNDAEIVDAYGDALFEQYADDHDGIARVMGVSGEDGDTCYEHFWGHGVVYKDPHSETPVDFYWTWDFYV